MSGVFGFFPFVVIRFGIICCSLNRSCLPKAPFQPSNSQFDRIRASTASRAPRWQKQSKEKRRARKSGRKEREMRCPSMMLARWFSSSKLFSCALALPCWGVFFRSGMGEVLDLFKSRYFILAFDDATETPSVRSKARKQASKPSKKQRLGSPSHRRRRRSSLLSISQSPKLFCPNRLPAPPVHPPGLIPTLPMCGTVNTTNCPL